MKRLKWIFSFVCLFVLMFSISGSTQSWNTGWSPCYNADYDYPDYSAVNQGLLGSSNTIKYYVDTKGSDNGTILFRHNSGEATTTYQLSTDETIPSNINTIFEKGAILNTDLSIRSAAYKWTQTDNYTLAYTDGGAHEIIVTDTLTGAISGATGIVTAITLTSGTWGGGDAAGVISLKNQTGTFEAENLNEGANSDVCTVASDSTQLSEYYLELAAGGDTGISTPSHCAENDSALTEATAGALAVSEWDWADNDTLGYSTVYVRLSDGADPDGKAADFVEAGYTLAINGPFDAGRYWVFSGNGSVTLNIGITAWVDWWGVPSETTLKAALDSNAMYIKVSSGNYNISSTVVIDRTLSFTLESDGTPEKYLKGGAKFTWDGAANGTMIQLNTARKCVFRNINLDGGLIADIGLHVGAVADPLYTKQLHLDRDRIQRFLHAGIQLGNHAVTGVDNDLAFFQFDSCWFEDNKYGIYIDTAQLQDNTINNCIFSGDFGGIVESHIYMERGGSFSMTGGHLGPHAVGSHYAIYVKDGWFNLFGVGVEYGHETGSQGGFIHLDTPVVVDSTKYAPCGVYGCRVSAKGVPVTNNIIKISSEKHPLIITGSSLGLERTDFTGRIIQNDACAPITSINNVYWAAKALQSRNFISINDTYYDGSDYFITSPKLTNFKTVTSAISPYTVESFINFIEATPTAGDIVINLPSVTDLTQMKDLMYIKLASGNGIVTITPDGAEIIDGAATLTLIDVYDAVILAPNRWNSWSVLSWVTGGVSEERLLSQTSVSFAANADTTLFTVPAGVRCVLTKAIVLAGADAGATTTLSIGAAGSETDFIPANTLSNLDAENDIVILQPIPNTIPLKNKSYAATTVIEGSVANQSGGATNYVSLYGYLY